MAVLAAAALGLGIALYAITDTGFILGVWVVGWWAIVRAAKKVPGASNPAPPPVPERGPDKKPQVRMVRDTQHPNRWIVARETPWLTYEPTKDDRDET